MSSILLQIFSCGMQIRDEVGGFVFFEVPVNDGMLDKPRTGISDGFVDGMCDGNDVDNVVGEADGVVDGKDDGFNDGCADDL